MSALTDFKPLHGRKNEYSALRQEFLTFALSPANVFGLRIVGISGYGGVGKSYLLASVLREVRSSLHESLLIRVDGSDPKLLGDLAGMIDQQLAPRRLPPPAKQHIDYFEHTRSVLRTLIRLREGVDRELDENTEITGTVKTIAKLIYKMRPLLAKTPKAGKIIDAILRGLETVAPEEQLEPKHIVAAVEALRGLRTLKGSRGFSFYRSRKERLRYDPFNTIGDAFTADLHAIVSHYRAKDIGRPKPGSVKSWNRVVLVVDDFETTGKVLGDFLVETVLRLLDRARFPTIAIFLGRDDIADAHTGFHQHFADRIVAKLRLEPLQRVDAVRYLESAGYAEADAQVIYDKSGGYPFILSLFAEHKSSNEQQSAVFYKRFFERTTHWMTEHEKEWLLNLCYLDTVNAGTIASMLSGVNAPLVMDWFAQEASVRDPTTPLYVVQPFIREMLLLYHRTLIGSAEREAFETRAREAMRHA